MTERQVAIINEENCIGCAICIEACPFDAIIGAQNYSHRINFNECPGCKICVNKCPTDCIRIIKINQNKNDIKETFKYNFTRKESRRKNIQKNYNDSIERQLKEILKS